MPTLYLPEGDHISRIVKPSQLMRDEVTQAVIGCFPDAFKLRDAEVNLSVSWLEFFSGTTQQRLQQVRDHAEMELRPNHGFANLNVGDTNATCQTMGHKVRIIHEPTDGNPAHSEIHRYPRDHDELFARLASIASQNLTLCRDLSAKETK